MLDGVTTLASRERLIVEEELGDREGEVRIEIEPKELGSCREFLVASDLVDGMESRRTRWEQRGRNKGR